MNAKKRLLYTPPAAEDYSRNFCKLYIVIAISFFFIAAQFVAGYISGSISVISDAFHLVTDLMGFVVSFIFISVSRRQPTEKMSFGYHRMELLGALGNLFIIWALALFFIYQATDRIINRQFVVDPTVMLIVGAGGLAINIIMFFVLHSGNHSHGLMSQSCDHPGPHDNQPNPSNCTDTSFCNQLICQDQICLKQINYSHCHTKDLKGDVKIHAHDKERKMSLQLGGKNAQNLEQSINQLQNQQIIIKGEHSSHIQQAGRKQGLGLQNHLHNENGHKHGYNCKHQLKKSPQKQKKHSGDCEHDNNKELKNQNQHKHKHKHGQNCKHDQSLKNHKHQTKNHKHDKDCTHQHIHNQGELQQRGHDYDHDHANEHGQEHGHSHEHSHQSISMQAAVLHALSDVIQSVGLLISSLFIYFLGSDKGAKVQEWNDWHYLDPISTYIFSIVVVFSTLPIVKNCYFLIMEATTSTQVVRQIKKKFQQSPGVVDVHDLHVWDLRPGKTLLIAHILAKQGAEREVLTNLTQICRHKKIYHSTLQVEEQNWKNHGEYILCDHNIH